jgi:hypothetical protein
MGEDGVHQDIRVIWALDLHVTCMTKVSLGNMYTKRRPRRIRKRHTGKGWAIDKVEQWLDPTPMRIKQVLEWLLMS